MILSPTISLTLGNLRYDQHVSRVSASLTTLPGVNSATVDLPAGVRFEAATGEDAILALDGGEGAHDVMTGTIHRIDRTPTRIRVMLADAGATLASLRVASTFKGLGAAEIVKAIASDADVEVGEMSMDLDAALYVADQRRTAAEHVAALCRMGGLFACVGGDGKLSGIAADSDTATIAIKYGREIIEVSSTSRRVPATPRLLMTSGPSGSADGSDSLRHSFAPVPDGAPDAGANALWIPAAGLRTPSGAQDASGAATGAMQARASTLKATCFLLPALRPGDVVEIQDLPAPLESGAWIVTRMRHNVGPGGGQTVFEGRLAGAGFDLLGSLMGAALGAIGGLL